MSNGRAKRKKSTNYLQYRCLYGRNGIGQVNNRTALPHHSSNSGFGCIPWEFLHLVRPTGSIRGPEFDIDHSPNRSTEIRTHALAPLVLLQSSFLFLLWPFDVQIQVPKTSLWQLCHRLGHSYANFDTKELQHHSSRRIPIKATLTIGASSNTILATSFSVNGDA